MSLDDDETVEVEKLYNKLENFEKLERVEDVKYPEYKSFNLTEEKDGFNITDDDVEEEKISDVNTNSTEYLKKIGKKYFKNKTKKAKTPKNKTFSGNKAKIVACLSLIRSKLHYDPVK